LVLNNFPLSGDYSCRAKKAVLFLVRYR